MTDHTPESPAIEALKKARDEILQEAPEVRGFLKDLDVALQRAEVCINACAGIPTEQIGDVKALVDAAEAELASPGSHTLTRSHLYTALAPFLRKD